MAFDSGTSLLFL